MQKVIGRKNELKIFDSLYNSTKSEFIAIYGRRRVGKTFLIRSAFENKFTFQITGMANVTVKQQLLNFDIALQQADQSHQFANATNWLIAFQQLIAFFEKSKK